MAISAIGLALVWLPERLPHATNHLANWGERLLCVLIAEPVNNFTRVPAPPPRPRVSPFEQYASTAAINVTYDAAFQANAAARNAFQAAVDIWSNQITTTVPITIDAHFDALDPGVLGSAGFTYVNRSVSVPVANTWYPIPIFNQYAGSDTVAPSFQITARFSSTRSDWYFGTDGATPAFFYDFESVVLHEIGHGLGFAGSMAYSAGTGSWGQATGFPFIYDRYVANGSGQSLIDTTLFPNPSAALGSQLTSSAGATSNLYWSGPKAAALNRNVAPRLYAPSTWADGSSISHLDDALYLAGNVNSLMTHAIGAAESVHDPGPITRGILQDSGWTLGCTYLLSPSGAVTSLSGGIATVTVTATSGCAWTATSNASFLTITGGASGTGSGTVTYSVSSLSSGSRIGTLTIAGQTFTVTQGPYVTVDRSSLKFAGVNTAGTLTPTTPSQEVTVAVSGVSSWTATANQAWVQIAGGSGTTSGRFTVSVVSNATLPATGSASATITVSAAGAVNTPQTVGVTLSLLANTATAAAFGAFDTPANNATGLVGAIAVTGWALDDIGVQRVEIWRNCVETIDRARGACAAVTPGGPGNFVFIGRAAFLAGARPDVEASFSTSPVAYRAGWGYLMLTNALPHRTKLTPEGGQGAFTLSAYAVDYEGRYTLLGTKTITLNNDAATVPFGAIDTPTQGGTVPETAAPYNNPNAYPNFGWAMTQLGKCIDTTSTSSYRVYIDGVSRTLTAGTNWFPGLNRSDIAAAYPGYCNTTNGLAAYYINAGALGLANGLHTIGWDVIDNQGKVAGIGSRFFTVINSGSSLKAGAQARSAIADAGTIFPRVGALASAVAAPDARTPVQVVRAGHPALETVRPDTSGVRRVGIRELQRVEIRVPAAANRSRDVRYSAYQVVGRQLRPLPVGSALDTRTGTLYWDPMPGFLGRYDFLIVRERAGREEQKVPVTVTISSQAYLCCETWVVAPIARAEPRRLRSQRRRRLQRGVSQG